MNTLKKKEMDYQRTQQINNEIIQEQRRNKIEQQFYEDELRYQRELAARGLSIRRERL